MEPIQADRTQQEKLVDLTEKLSTHNATHGKNVVFWSCKRCNPKNEMDFHHEDCRPWIKNDCWHSYEDRKSCEYKQDCDSVVGARMKCSAQCKSTPK